MQARKGEAAEAIDAGSCLCCPKEIAAWESALQVIH